MDGKNIYWPAFIKVKDLTMKNVRDFLSCFILSRFEAHDFQRITSILALTLDDT